MNYVSNFAHGYRGRELEGRSSELGRTGVALLSKEREQFIRSVIGGTCGPLDHRSPLLESWRLFACISISNLDKPLIKYLSSGQESQ
jgi:hypothetical protein